MPHFSIIIPVFNKEAFVDKTIKSVLSQTFADFEIIVINDGSTDNSEAKILEYKDPRIIYYSKKNEGVSISRNFGIGKVTSEFICFLDADDLWYPNFLETIHFYSKKLFQQKVFATAYEIETSKRIFPAHYSLKKTADFELTNYFEASTKESVLWTSSAVFHKDVFTKAGNFNGDLNNFEDIDLWIRIGLKYPIVFIWKVQARYVFDANGLSRNNNVLNTKIDFSGYSSLEKTNPNLKLFLDLNRFSLAIKSKLADDSDNFNKYYKAIDLNKIGLKKRILLIFPSFILRILISIKLNLANMGLGNSFFR